jgi:phage tail-like protein
MASAGGWGVPPEVPRGINGQVPVGNRFVLVIDGVDIGVFQEVSGLSFDVGVDPLSEGGQNGFEHKFPKRITWPNLVFKRGIVDNDELFAWVARSSGQGFTTAGNKLKRSTGSVVLLGSDNAALRIWDFYDAFPVKWSGPTLSATSSEVLSETIEVAHHGFVSKKPGGGART